jgi:hypothetical protein
MDHGTISSMSDEALTAYLFGIAVACPFGLPMSQCPLVEFQGRSLGEKFDYLGNLTRTQKLQMASRHFSCAGLLPDYLHPRAAQSRALSNRPPKQRVAK